MNLHVVPDLPPPDDETVAAWAKEQNRGIPPWNTLSEEVRQWWRDMYVVRHGVYESYDDYNADVIAAREAYAADQRVQSGMCAVGCGRKKDGHHRLCWTCRREGRIAK